MSTISQLFNGGNAKNTKPYTRRVVNATQAVNAPQKLSDAVRQDQAAAKATQPPAPAVHAVVVPQDQVIGAKAIDPRTLPMDPAAYVAKKTASGKVKIVSKRMAQRTKRSANAGASSINTPVSSVWSNIPGQGQAVAQGSNAPGSSGFFKDVNGDGKVDFMDSVLSSFEFFGRVPEFMARQQVMLFLPISGIAIGGTLNAAAWVSACVLSGVAAPLGVLAWASFTYTESGDRIRYLGKRGEALKLVRAAMQPGLLPDISADNYQLLIDYKEGMTPSDRRKGRNKTLFLCALETIILGSVVNPFSGGFKILSVLGFGALVFAVSYFLDMYHDMLLNLSTQEEKDALDRVLRSNSVKTVKV